MAYIERIRRVVLIRPYLEFPRRLEVSPAMAYWLSMAPLLIALALHIVLSTYPLPRGHDAAHHRMWLTEFSHLVQNGELIPRWLPNSFSGFGSPTFYFYPPLAYYLGSVFVLLGAASDGDTLYSLVQLSAVATSIVGIRRLLLYLGTTAQRANLGALLYSLAPYHFADAFLRTAITEYLALAWLPFVFLGGLRIIRSGSTNEAMRGVVVAATAWGALMLTNLPTAVCAGVVLIPFVLTYRPSRVRLTAFMISIVFGTMLASVYLFPAAEYLKYIRAGELFRVIQHGIAWDYALQVIFQATLDDEKLYFIVLATLATSVGVTAHYWHKLKALPDTQALPWISVLILAVLLQVPLVSTWLYELLLPLQLVQFSWRFTSVITLALAVLLVRSDGAFYRSVIVFTGLLSLVLYLQQIDLRPSVDWSSDHSFDAPEYVPAYVPYRDSVFVKRILCDEHLPLVFADCGTDIAAIERTPTGVNAHVSASSGAIVTFHQFYWPNWRVGWVQDRSLTRLEVRPSVDGYLTVRIPKGAGRLHAYMVRGAAERIGETATLATAALLGLASIWVFLRRPITK